MKLGLLALGRSTFDVEFAQQNLDAMLAALDSAGIEPMGPRAILFDEAATRAAIDDLKAAQVDQVLIMQVTFTDAAMTALVAREFSCPLSLWAIPEPRLGGRLRLNSFCGLNLASHALSLTERKFSWLYAAPTRADIGSDLEALIAGQRRARPVPLAPAPAVNPQGRAIAEATQGQKIARIGEHPIGFDTCAYDASKLQALAGVEVVPLELAQLFETARAVEPCQVSALHDQAKQDLAGLDQVEAAALDRSLRLKAALDDLRASHNVAAFAIRCWPETFTEYGGAVCGPAAMMGEARVPCACEADIYGALTQILLSKAADAPVFLTDLVDMDPDDNTAVVWHCGQAPMSMRDPQSPAEATIHTNRKQPLLYQFTLKPGPVTLLRISQARGKPHMVLSYAEMLRRPMAFTGTSGVMRFARPARAVLSDIIGCGLEHHMALAYGDHRDALRGLAGALKLPILEL